MKIAQFITNEIANKICQELSEFLLLDLAKIVIEYTGTILNVNDKLDVLDTQNDWCPAQVLEIKNNEIYIYFIGWQHKWNEWISIDHDARLDYLGKRSIHTKASRFIYVTDPEKVVAPIKEHKL